MVAKNETKHATRSQKKHEQPAGKACIRKYWRGCNDFHEFPTVHSQKRRGFSSMVPLYCTGV
jgi:hypothetical protein